MKKLYMYILYISGVLLLSCCDFFSTSCTLTCRLPETPGHWKERFRSFTYEVWYIGETGEFQKKNVEMGKRSFTLPCKKQRNNPILAFPQSGTISFPPAGALFPIDVCNPETEIMDLTWERGFIALIIMECMKNGADMTTFNTERLHKELIEKAEGDVWNLDLTSITEKLTSGSFSVHAIKKLPCKEVAFYPGPGIWFLESPFSPLFTLDEGYLFIFPLPYGYHRLFHLSSSLSYSLYIDHTEIIVIRRD